MSKQDQIQSAVDAAIATVPFSHRQRDTKTTKKALAEIAALGLTEYLPALMREHGGKYASSVAAVIRAATFTGSSKIGSSMGEDGDSWVETTDAHELYNLLNAPEPAIKQTKPVTCKDDDGDSSTDIEVFIYGEPIKTVLPAWGKREQKTVSHPNQTGIAITILHSKHRPNRATAMIWCDGFKADRIGAPKINKPFDRAKAYEAAKDFAVKTAYQMAYDIYHERDGVL